MKLRKIIGVSALGLVLALTGCGKSAKLVCTQDGDMGKVETVIKFNGDKVESLDMTTSFETDEAADFMEALYKGMEYDATRDGKKITIKLTNKEIEKEFGKETVASKDDMKKALEQDGYTCK